MAEGEESYTTKQCKKCNKESLEEKGDKPLTKWQWHEFVEKEAHRGGLWEMMGKEHYVRGMWEHFYQERARVKRFREEAKKSRQEYKASGSWSQRVLGARLMLQ